MSSKAIKAVEMDRRAGYEEEKSGVESGVARANSSDFHPLALEDTPAYQVLRSHGLLINKYRINVDIGGDPQITATHANSTRGKNLVLNSLCCPCKCCIHTFEVPAGHVRLVEDGRGGFAFHDQGVHLICDLFYRVHHNADYSAGVIKHGDRTIVVINQGHIGFAVDKGQPVLLPPGLHQWQSPTLKFEQTYDLNNNVVRMGPLTLVTVDDGYAAVTEDNGKQNILDGGRTYLLTHRNWKFQKFITQKIQSSVLNRICATSADNVLMAVDATVIWRISDVRTAAMNSAETISRHGGDSTGTDLGDISKLTNDVLKQSEASLAAFIGVVNYSDSFNVAANVHKPVKYGAVDYGDSLPQAAAVDDARDDDVAAPAPAMPSQSSALFDVSRLRTCIDHANEITATYGVNIISINVVAAVPNDPALQASLAQGAVAAAEALKFETVARGRAAAAKIEAKGEAEAAIIRAKGEADAEELRARGSKQAADTLATSETAVRFAMIDKTGAAMDRSKAFFFGADPKDLGGLLAGPVTAAASAIATR